MSSLYEHTFLFWVFYKLEQAEEVKEWTFLISGEIINRHTVLVRKPFKHLNKHNGQFQALLNHPHVFNSWWEDLVELVR